MSFVNKKIKTAYYCSQCGAVHLKWQGQCKECEAWNSLIEEKVPSRKTSRTKSEIIEPLKLSDVSIPDSSGYNSDISEFDRVLGGMLIPGMSVLIAGEPGIGKSTLLLQAADAYAKKNISVLYITGEESLPQIKLRAKRLCVSDDKIELFNDISLENILHLLEQKSYNVIFIDSIQTITSEIFDSPPGTVGQIREAASKLISSAKQLNSSLFLVGHVNKEGLVAGPKVLEHMVDTVISFEGDSTHLYRMLRATKNRFGSLFELGIFEMTSNGLMEVENPSKLFLNDQHAPGAVVTAICEGNRPLLIEIQALVAPANYGNPQRVAGGIDSKKLALLLAILEKRGGYPISSHDVFLSIAGGLRVNEPSLDLSAIVAIVSSLHDKAIDPKTVVMGEVGLTGEVRGITNIEQRVAEAARLGFNKMLIPHSNLSQIKNQNAEIVGINDIQTALEFAFD